MSLSNSSPLALAMVALLVSACGSESGKTQQQEVKCSGTGAGTDRLIVNFEDPSIANADSSFKNGDNLQVHFYTWDEGVGINTISWELASPGRESSQRELRFTYTSPCNLDPALPAGECYGAGAGISVAGPCYDASAYDGISVWLRGKGSGNLTLMSPVADQAIDSGECNECYWIKQYLLTDAWTNYMIQWEAIIAGPKQTSFPSEKFDGVDFYLNNATGFDDMQIDIDDLEFLGGNP